jgi:hypothetical protein
MPEPVAEPADPGDMPAVTQPVPARSIPEAAGATLPNRTPEAAGATLPNRTPGAAVESLPEPAASPEEPARGFSEPTEQGPAPVTADTLPARKPGAAVAETPASAAEPRAAVDNRETEIRPELVVPPHMRPPVDPWPDADPPHWRPDPDATMPTSPPPHEGRTPLPPRQRDVPKKSKSAPNRTAHPVVAHARPISPPTPASGRAMVAPPRPARVPEQKREARPPARPEPRQPRKRRRNPVLRFLQVLLSVLTMICVPLIALILAYGYGNGVSLEKDAINVFEDIGRLLNL